MVAGQVNKSGAAKGGVNQYAAPTQTGYAAPAHLYGNVPAYADPSDTAENGYSDSPVVAWAAPLRSAPGGFPDPMRLGTMPIHDYRPDPHQAPENWWVGPGPGREVQARHNSAEFVDADGMALSRQVGGPGKRAALDSRRTPPPESRLTQQMSPHRYVFTRAFDQHAPHRLNGEHFSMADHRRTYDVLGMAPVVNRRNTYRADPAPWDTGLTDYPTSSNAYTGGGGYLVNDSLPQRNRSGRLD